MSFAVPSWTNAANNVANIAKSTKTVIAYGEMRMVRIKRFASNVLSFRRVRFGRAYMCLKTIGATMSVTRMASSAMAKNATVSAP